MVLKTIAEVRLVARCNWCRSTLDTSEVMTDSNFVDTGKTFPSDGTVAYAVYCNECLASSFRTSQPKSVVNRNTLYEVDVVEL
jgi:hypothetical protein